MRMWDSVATRTWIRRRGRTRFAATFAAVWSLGIGATPLLAGNPHLLATSTDYLAAGMFFLAFACPGLLLARRVATAGLWLGPDGVVVRGPLRTRSVPLADAQTFAPGVQNGARNGTPCPMLSRRNAAPIGVWALGREGLVFRFDRYLADLQPLCDELNKLLESLRG
jgi:hypothetical protein